VRFDASYSVTDEGDCVVDVVEGPEDACVRLYPRLIGSLSLYCGDRHVAEDLAQETLVRLWDRWGSIENASAVDAWAYRTAINLANSGFRRRKAERRAHARLDDVGVVDGPDQATALAVRQAIAGLPRRQRQALVLRYYGGFTVDEVAALMGCAAGTVKAHAHKAVAALRSSSLIDGEVSADA
jgi:RNA polymerase sigma-70 factor (sigma-E family)